MFKMKIKIWNAAFDDEGIQTELARILRFVAKEIEAGIYNDKIRDINGNEVGEYSIS